MFMFLRSMNTEIIVTHLVLDSFSIDKNLQFLEGRMAARFELPGEYDYRRQLALEYKDKVRRDKAADAMDLQGLQNAPEIMKNKYLMSSDAQRRAIELARVKEEPSMFEAWNSQQRNELFREQLGQGKWELQRNRMTGAPLAFNEKTGELTGLLEPGTLPTEATLPSAMGKYLPSSAGSEAAVGELGLPGKRPDEKEGFMNWLAYMGV